MFSAIMLMIGGVMRIVDAIWAFQYSGAPPAGLNHALAG
jgi:hypothetical protein